MNWREFQEQACRAMSAQLGVELTERKMLNVPKKFDMVSADFQYVGDAKYLTLVQGVKNPPAKMMEIAGHVWLLEKTAAKRQFLIFGNQREVPELWLRKYGILARGVEFYFLDEGGSVERLNP
jgi:hypothetical protein